MNSEPVLTDSPDTRPQAEAPKLGTRPARPAFEWPDMSLPMSDKSRKTIEMLKRWAKEDESATEEQRQRYRAALAAIDEHRPHRKLFEDVLAEDTE